MIGGPSRTFIVANPGKGIYFGDHTVHYLPYVDTYRWDFDDSDGIQVDSASSAPTHTYHEAGIYTVTLTTWLHGENTVDTAEVYVGDKLHSQSDPEGDVLNEFGKKVGGHDGIDITMFEVHEVDGTLILVIEVAGTIHQGWDVLAVYTVNIFQDPSDNLKELEDADYVVNYGLESCTVEDKSTNETTDLEYSIESGNRLVILLPESLIGTYAGSRMVATSVELGGMFNGFVDMTIDLVEEDDDDEPDITMILIVVAVIMIIVSAFLIFMKKDKTSDDAGVMPQQPFNPPGHYQQPPYHGGIGQPGAPPTGTAQYRTQTTQCTACGSAITITTPQRPTSVQCPGCNAWYTIR